MLTHTVGDWKFVGECEPLEVRGSQFQVWDQTGRPLAAVVSTEDTSIGFSEGRLNAFLIAAAPKLLAALKRVRQAFYVDGKAKALREAFEGTKELVAEAEGR